LGLPLFTYHRKCTEHTTDIVVTKKSPTFTKKKQLAVSYADIVSILLICQTLYAGWSLFMINVKKTLKFNK